MTNSLRTLFLAGVGLTHNLVERVKKEVDQLAEKGKKADDPGSKVAKDIYDRVEKNWCELREFLVPSRVKEKKISELSKEITKLKKEIDKLKHREAV